MGGSVRAPSVSLPPPSVASVPPAPARRRVRIAAGVLLFLLGVAAGYVGGRVSVPSRERPAISDGQARLPAPQSRGESAAPSRDVDNARSTGMSDSRTSPPETAGPARARTSPPESAAAPGSSVPTASLASMVIAEPVLYTVVVDGLASMPDAMAVTVTLREHGFTHADVATGDGPLAVRLGAPERLWEAVRNGERVRGLGYPVRVIAERAKG